MNLSNPTPFGIPFPFGVHCPGCQETTRDDLRPIGGTTRGEPIFRHTCGTPIIISAFLALEIMNIPRADARSACELLEAGEPISEVSRRTLLSLPKIQCLEFLHDDGLAGLLRVLNAAPTRSTSTPAEPRTSPTPEVFDSMGAAESILLEMDFRQGLKLPGTVVVGDVIKAAVNYDRNYFRSFRFAEDSLAVGIPRRVMLKCLWKANWRSRGRVN